MTEPAPRPAVQIFPPRLSPAGRERFGELLAKQLWLLAGGMLALIVAPTILGAAKLPAVVPALSTAFAFVSATAAIVIHFLSVERLGETASVEGQEP
ncbi:MAG: hypothetical protein Q8L23_12975 [Caulobacter sp.]|nr:hypothetical protein [Caulobacter sp.]